MVCSKEEKKNITYQVWVAVGRCPVDNVLVEVTFLQCRRILRWYNCSGGKLSVLSVTISTKEEPTLSVYSCQNHGALRAKFTHVAFPQWPDLMGCKSSQHIMLSVLINYKNTYKNNKPEFRFVDVSIFKMDWINEPWLPWGINKMRHKYLFLCHCL